MALLGVACSDADAQAWHVTPFVGYAQHSPTTYGWGVSPDWSHQMIGVSFDVPVLSVGGVTLRYAPVAVPVLRLSLKDKGWTLATGLAPFGLRLDARGVYAQTAVGGLWAADNIPTAQARKFNVTLEAGGGVELHRLQLGYKWHHLSNAGSRASNPGIDAHLFYAGWRVH